MGESDDVFYWLGPGEVHMSNSRVELFKTRLIEFDQIYQLNSTRSTRRRPMPVAQVVFSKSGDLMDDQRSVILLVTIAVCKQYRRT
jgi:hypothetical protein